MDEQSDFDLGTNTINDPGGYQARFSIPKNKYRCPKGHEWEGCEFNMSASYGPGPVRITGPLCPYCVMDFLEANFPAEIVESEDEGDMVSV